eukprot:scaffold11578_cov56-Cylindrotheca_fusiformis.AAC.2
MSDDLKSIETTDGYDDDDEECWADEHIQENPPARNRCYISSGRCYLYSRLSGHGPANSQRDQ